jgi:excisionase family DNA binding protein
MNNSNLLLTVRQFCALTGISRAQFYLEVAAGRIATRRLGLRGVRIRREDAEDWVASLPAPQHGHASKKGKP